MSCPGAQVPPAFNALAQPDHLAWMPSLLAISFPIPQSPVFSFHSSAYIVAPLWSFGKYSIHKHRGICYMLAVVTGVSFQTTLEVSEKR